MQHIADMLELYVNREPNDCPYCAEVLARMREESARRRDDAYGTRRFDGQFVEGYTLRPDRNAGGNVTHWHIEITPERA